MKRPSRPAKRKPASKKTAKRKVKNVPAPSVPWTEEEAAMFERPAAPANLAYQWASHEQAFRMQVNGWVQVPYARHSRELPPSCNLDGYVVYRGMALFQLERSLVAGALDLGRKKAKDIARASGNEALELLAGHCDPRNFNQRTMPLLSPSFMVDREYDRVPDEGPKVVDLTIKFMASWRWQDAAAALKLDLAEYITRRLIMTGQFLGPDEDGIYSTLEVTTKKAEDGQFLGPDEDGIYSPLQVTTKKAED